MKKLWWFNLCLVLFLVGSPAAAWAQESQPEGPLYIVQVGDTMWSIAQRFSVSLDALAQVNGVQNANRISPGDALTIPGLEGINGVLVTQEIPFGETIASIAHAWEIPIDVLAQLNHITMPDELVYGRSLIVPQAEQQPEPVKRLSLAAGQSLLELAVLQGTSPWTLVDQNDLSSPWDVIPGEVLMLPGGNLRGPGALPGAIADVSAGPFAQGKTAVIVVQVDDGLTLQGSLLGHALHFFPDGPGRFVALQGVHAMADPGRYRLTLTGQTPAGSEFAFAQWVAVAAENYPYDRPLIVDPETVDPAITGPEDDLWYGLMADATPERFWQGAFTLPSPLPQDYCLESGQCWPSRFGNRRSYNGGPYNAFHTGLDIAGKIGTEIYAAAPGDVVFAGPLTVRGNATVIDHGWGVYSAYLHQSEFYVSVGDHVDAGQVIGLVGNTGRVEGPHLHWEVWAGGVQVDPLDWLTQAYP